MVEKNDVSLETQDSVDVKRKEPQLRFREFNGDWKEKNINQLCQVIGGGTPSTENEEYWNGNINWYTPSEIGQTKYVSNSERKITELGLKKSSAKLLPKGTILLSTRATIGECSITKTESSTNQGFQSLITNNQNNNEFIYYLIPQFKKEMIRKSSGSTFLEISKKEVEKLKVFVPSLNEQKEISNFLSLIDKKIEFLEKTLVLYQKIKKHILEQIFANLKCESESLDKVTFYQEGPGVRNYQYTKEGIKLLNVGNFVENELILENTDRYISEEEAYGKYKHFLVDEGDLLIACSGIKAEYFDEKITFAKKEHLPLCMNTSTMRFKTLNENKLNLNYLKWYFQTVMFKKQIFGVLTGSAQFNFGPTHLKYLKVLIPPIEQQIVISNFLDFLKNHTDKLSKEIYLMKEYKKGLLQKMFV